MTCRISHFQDGRSLQQNHLIIARKFIRVE